NREAHPLTGGVDRTSPAGRPGGRLRRQRPPRPRHRGLCVASQRLAPHSGGAPLMSVLWITADVFDGLARLDDASVDLVVTSPPFLALRSYLPADHPDKEKEIGSEANPAAFIDVMLAATAELRRVLAPHGSI